MISTDRLTVYLTWPITFILHAFLVVILTFSNNEKPASAAAEAGWVINTGSATGGWATILDLVISFNCSFCAFNFFAHFSMSCDNNSKHVIQLLNMLQQNVLQHSLIAIWFKWQYNLIVSISPLLVFSDRSLFDQPTPYSSALLVSILLTARYACTFVVGSEWTCAL